MRRVSIILLIVLLLGIPIVLLVIHHWAGIVHTYTMLVASKRQVSSRYSVANTVPGYVLTLPDTAYLDYITAQLGIFTDDGVIDPAENLGHKEIQTRYTVTNVRFELISPPPQFIVGVDGVDTFAYGVSPTTRWQVYGGVRRAIIPIQCPISSSRLMRKICFSNAEYLKIGSCVF